MVQNYIAKAIAHHKLPSSFAATVERWYRPIVQDLANMLANTPNKTFILGVQGTQGSGKSTLADFLKLILEHEFQLRAAVLSIDDFYLTRKERQNLAKQVHPLLITRGVPGTHDVNLILQTFAELQNLTGENSALIPRFNKALDEREPETNWDTVTQAVNIIIFEGWCVAATPQTDQQLLLACNQLEHNEDPQGLWRSYVNNQLKSDYTRLFNKLDALVVLNAPSFDCVFNWRLLQEQKLAEKWHNEHPDQAAMVQTPQQLKRFISHYQRITEDCLTNLPKRANWLLTLDQNHEIYDLTKNEHPPSYGSSEGSDLTEKTKIIVSTDLDGTLLDHDTYSFSAALPALRKLKEYKIPIILNTSKTQPEVKELQSELKISDPFIVENGSAVYIPKDYFPNLSDFDNNLEEQGLFWIKILGQKRLTINEILYALKSRFGWQFEGYKDWSIEQVIAKTGLSKNAAQNSCDRSFSEPILWTDSDENLIKFKNEIAKHNLKIIRGGRFTHVLGQCDKGTALNWLASIYSKNKATPITIIALGDSQNDVDMLTIADYAVAVRSPVQPHPTFTAKGEKILTSQYGPEGWNQAMLEIISASGN